MDFYCTKNKVQPTSEPKNEKKTYIFSMPKIEMFYGECIHNWHLHAVPQ